MKAVLAATTGKKKIYYLLDANSAESDGVVVNSENKATPINFFLFSSKMKKLNRIKNTPFHRFLWTTPDGEMKQIWMDTFVLKKRPIGKKFMENLVIHSQLGESSKKQKQTEMKVKAFLDKATTSNPNSPSLSRIKMLNKSFIGENHE